MFKKGDKVRVLPGQEIGSLEAGSVHTVLGYNSLGNLMVRESDLGGGFYPERFELVPQPKFQAGDKIRGNAENRSCCPAEVMRADSEHYTLKFEGAQNASPGRLVRLIDLWYDLVPASLEHFDKAVSKAVLGETKPGQAMRFNSGKPELAYLLSFNGGIQNAFRDSRFEAGLIELAKWYRDDHDADELGEIIATLIDELDEEWPELLAKTSMKGAEKYARGNYLKGRGWHDTLNSLLRHMHAIENKGEENDPELGIPHDGPIAWGLLFLQHCVETMPELDDRLRAPEAAE